MIGVARTPLSDEELPAAGSGGGHGRQVVRRGEVGSRTSRTSRATTPIRRRSAGSPRNSPPPMPRSAPRATASTTSPPSRRSSPSSYAVSARWASTSPGRAGGFARPRHREALRHRPRQRAVDSPPTSTPTSTKARSSASTTTWARRRCRTSWRCGSPNSVFEPVWNRRHVDHVQVMVAESLGVEGRGEFYEQAGALRDIVQNHLMQVLALTLMEPPGAAEGDVIRDEKEKLLGSVVVFDEKEAASAGRPRPVRRRLGRRRNGPRLSRRARRRPAFAGGDVRRDARRRRQLALGGRADLRAHRQAAPPSPDRGVGWSSNDRRTCPSPASSPRDLRRDSLTLRIQPDDGISLTFGAKVPGPTFTVSNVSMDFSYQQRFPGQTVDAYDRLLLDAMLGDPTLFIRDDEVQRAWTIVRPIQQAFAEGSPPLAPLRGRELGAGGGAPSDRDRRPALAQLRVDTRRGRWSARCAWSEDVGTAFAELAADEMRGIEPGRDGSTSGAPVAPPGWSASVALPLEQGIPWGSVECYFADERCVDPASPDANAVAIAAALGGVRRRARRVPPDVVLGGPRRLRRRRGGGGRFRPPPARARSGRAHRLAVPGRRRTRRPVRDARHLPTRIPRDGTGSDACRSRSRRSPFPGSSSSR